MQKLDRFDLGWMLGGLAMFGAFTLDACSGAPQLTSDVACRLNALRVLPEDPEQVTAFDAIEVVRRVRACGAGDAGR